MGLLQILGLGPQPQLQPAGLPVSSQDTVNATGSGKAPAVDKNKQAFDSARAAMKLLVDGIANHPQKDEITAQVDSARAKLKDADDQATAKAWPAATKLLGEVKTICQAAKKLADDWQKYKRERTSLLAAGMSFSSQDSKNNENWAQNRIDEANLLVTQTPPKFDAALQVLKKAMAQLKPIVKQLLDTAQARLKTLEKTKTALKAFAQNELDQGRQLIASAQASFDAGEWSACRTTALHALRFVAPAIRMVEGRGVFEEERAKAVAAIVKVRAADAVKDQATALDSLLADADKLGAYDTRKFDEGARQLQAIAQKAALWTGLAKTVAAYRKDEAAVALELDALDKHAAAARLATERQAIRTLLAAAKNLAAQAPAAADPAAAWAGAAASLARARTDLGVAKKTAESLGAAAGAENAAKNPADTAALATALQKLAADGKVAAKGAGADQAAAQLKRFDEKVALVSQALQAKDGAKAAPLLAEAAAALAEAKVIQAGHAQLVAARPAIEAELKALKKSKRAASIKGRIDAVEAALADALARRPGACRHRSDGSTAPRQRRPGCGQEGRRRPQALRRRGRGARQARRRQQGRRHRARRAEEARRRCQGACRRLRLRRRRQGPEGARGAPRQGQARGADGRQGRARRRWPSWPARWWRAAAPRPSTT